MTYSDDWYNLTIFATIGRVYLGHHLGLPTAKVVTFKFSPTAKIETFKFSESKGYGENPVRIWCKFVESKE